MFRRLRKISRELSRFSIPATAAGASFYLALSAFPLLALVLCAVRALPFSVSDLRELLAGVLPAALLPAAEAALRDLGDPGAAVASLSALLALWSASSGVYAILKELNAILGAPETRSWLRRRLTALFYTFLLLLAILLTLALQVFGRRLAALLGSARPALAAGLAALLRMRFWFSGGALTLLFTLIFAVFPARRMRLRDVVPAAALAAAGWLAFSGLFSIYANLGCGLRRYGGMALPLLTLLWLDVCVSILFCGGVLCRLSADGLLARGKLGLFLDEP